MSVPESFSIDQVSPRDIKLRREAGVLEIAWRDGRVSAFDLPTLRQRCPCAACNAERDRRSRTTELFPILKKDPGTGPPKALGAQLVGNYALQLLWADGHNTGIYEFRYLRRLDVQAESAPRSEPRESGPRQSEPRP